MVRRKCRNCAQLGDEAGSEQRLTDLHQGGQDQSRPRQRKIVFNLHISRAGCVNPLRREQDETRPLASGLLTFMAYQN